MSFKRNTTDQDQDDDDSQVFHKRQRFDDDDGNSRGRGRGGRGDMYGRGRGRGRGDGGFRGRGRGGGGGFRGGGDRNNGFRGGGFRGGDRNSGFRGGDRNNGFRGGGDRNGFRGGRGRGGRDRGGRGRGGFGGGGFNREERETFIKVGQNAPSFSNILNDKSDSTSLDQFKGQYIALFIYFRDGTYGCTEEQKSFRDAKDAFDKHNAIVLGVSRDSVDNHAKAVEENQLNYTLLADTEGEITKAYGAIDNDRVTRSTFLISPEGKIAAVWGRVMGFDKHGHEVASKLEEIATGKSGDEIKNTNDNEENDDNDDNEDDDNDENADEDDNDNDNDDE